MKKQYEQSKFAGWCIVEYRNKKLVLYKVDKNSAIVYEDKKISNEVNIEKDLLSHFLRSETEAICSEGNMYYVYFTGEIHRFENKSLEGITFIKEIELTYFSFRFLDLAL